MVGETKSSWPMRLARIPLYLLALTVLFPYYWMVSSAFKPLGEITKAPPTLIVQNPTTANFYNPKYDPAASDAIQGLFQRFSGAGFASFFVNSLAITIFVTVVSLILASAAGYVIAKHKFPGSRIVFFLIIGSMMIPWQVTLIPNFLTMRDLGWINTFWALLIPGLAKAFAVFFLIQSIRGVPQELFDAARIDGAGEIRVWWQIVLPLVRPALAAMAIFVSLGEWNSFLWPLLVVNDDAHATLPLALGRLAGSITSDPRAAGPIMAATLLASIPTLIFFLMFQRQFVSGITVGSVKG